MAETQDATDGYMGQFWLNDGTALYKLHEVTGFDIPGSGGREQVEKTHLESPGRRRQYLSTFYEDSDFTVTVNTRLLSDTDTKVEAARIADATRAFKAVIPEEGVPVAQIEGTLRVIAYTRGRVANNEVIQGTITCRVVTVDAVEAYAA